jgi:hypothetical protein
MQFFHNRNDKLMTGGNYNLHVWTYDRPNNKLRPQEAQLGQLQRSLKAICIDHKDQYAYCGTTSGDVLQVTTAACLCSSADSCTSSHSGAVRQMGCRSSPHANRPMQVALERVLFKNSGPAKDPFQARTHP